MSRQVRAPRTKFEHSSLSPVLEIKCVRSCLNSSTSIVFVGYLPTSTRRPRLLLRDFDRYRWQQHLRNANLGRGSDLLLIVKSSIVSYNPSGPHSLLISVFVNRHHFDLKMTENDADAQKPKSAMGRGGAKSHIPHTYATPPIPPEG